MIRFTPLDPRVTADHLGLIPFFFNEGDERTAAEQIDANYQHGGGFRAIKGFRVIDPERGTIRYPGDPTLKPYAKAVLHGEEATFGNQPMETIYIYQSGMVAIFQPNGEFQVTRCD